MKKEVNLITTNHETTRIEQFDKFLEEYKELKEAVKELETVRNEHNIEHVVNEAIDVAKSLKKYLKGESITYVNTEFEQNSTNIYYEFLDVVDTFLEFNCDGMAILIIELVLDFAYKLCKENGMDFWEELKKNDKKNEDRNYHKEEMK